MKRALGLIKYIHAAFFGFMDSRSIWVYWAVYFGLSAGIFAIFYIALNLLALQWWVTLAVIIAFAMAWGSAAYIRNTDTAPES